MKTLEQTKEWYISAVKATLVLNFNALENEAEKAIENYGLKKKIDADPESQLSNSIDGVAEDIARKEFVGRSNQLVYKGFFTEVRYDSQLRHLYGRVYGTEDFVTFETSCLNSVEGAFHKAVDEYLAHRKASEEKVPEVEKAAEFIKDTEPVVRPALPDEPAVCVCPESIASGVSVSDSPVAKDTCGVPESAVATPTQATADSGVASNSEDVAKIIDSMSDEEFLKSMGIEPDEEANAAYKEEEISKEEAKKAISEMTDPEFLKSMGIDPDEVVL